MATLSQINAEHAAVEALDFDSKAHNISSVEQSMRIDEASATVTYVGVAAIASSEGGAVWKIKRITITGNVTDVKYADGNANYDNIWTNRASLSYS
jgi:hypothetical protein